jgi:hypothetical protein
VTSQYGYSANSGTNHEESSLCGSKSIETFDLQEDNGNQSVPSHYRGTEQESEECTNDLHGKDLAWLLFDTALMNSGFSMEDGTASCNLIWT